MTKKAKSLITFFAILSFCVITTLIVVVCVDNTKINNYKEQLNSTYQNNLYSLCDSTNNIEMDLSKLLVAQNKNLQEKYLTEIVSLCEASQNSLASLPLNHQSLSNTYKFVNQLGGYCFVLNQNLIVGKEIEDKDYEQLQNLYKSSKEINIELNKISNLVNTGYSIVDNISDSNIRTNSFSGEWSAVYDETIEYPSLIYDGPFSDSVENKKINGLSENIITFADAQNKLKNWFNDYEITFVGESEGGDFDTFNFEVSNSNNWGYAQISKRDGILLSYSSSQQSNKNKKSILECELIAKGFAEKFDFKNCDIVWSDDSNGFVYFNLTNIQDGVIIYPDMIKIKINRETGDLSGFEARSWAYNHTERENLIPTLSKSQTEKLLNSKMEILTTKLCVVPAEYLGENLAWEIKCFFNDDIYYVYIDANSGEELKVLKVVQTEDGSLLM